MPVAVCTVLSSW